MKTSDVTHVDFIKQEYDKLCNLKHNLIEKFLAKTTPYHSVGFKCHDDKQDAYRILYDDQSKELYYSTDDNLRELVEKQYTSQILNLTARFENLSSSDKIARFRYIFETMFYNENNINVEIRGDPIDVKNMPKLNIIFPLYSIKSVPLRFETITKIDKKIRVLTSSASRLIADLHIPLVLQNNQIILPDIYKKLYQLQAYVHEIEIKIIHLEKITFQQSIKGKKSNKSHNEKIEKLRLDTEEECKSRKISKISNKIRMIESLIAYQIKKCKSNSIRWYGAYKKYDDHLSAASEFMKKKVLQSDDRYIEIKKLVERYHPNLK